MPHPATVPQPARQVDRIREILVGRQMQDVEQRLEKLEQAPAPMPVAGPASVFDTELKALRSQQEEHLNRLRDEIDADRLRQLDETRRLSHQIQAIARSRGDSSVGAAKQELEQHLAQWLQNWQQGLQSYLKQREDHLINSLRSELDKVRAQSAHSGTPNPNLQKYQQSFERLADFARSMAEELKAAAQPNDRP